MRACFALVLLLAALPATAQDAADLPFEVEVVERDVPAMPGLHSFAWAQADGKWLFVTGRVNGLHGIVEAGPFPADQANDAVWVVDLAANQVWSRSLDELPDAVSDPLRVTNPEFYQNGETLYVVGGYGKDSATGGKITFPTLTAIDVPGTIAAVTTGDALAPHLRQTEGDHLAVTGGDLRDFFGQYVLFGGQRFDGEYSAGGQGFTQAYTERILLLDIDDDGQTVETSESLALDYDPETLHRRDMTVAPTYYLQRTIEGDTIIAEGYGMYGGVFRPDATLPLRNPVYFGFTDIPEYWTSNFEQQFAHYTSPALPLYDAETETMHTTFFGGMSQFYFDEETGEVEEDLLVPFTDDIVTLTADLSESGDTYETVMPEPMPGLLGTNAVLIPAPGVPRSALGIIRLRELTDRTLVGWIVGGIASTAPNPGWRGMSAAETSASDRVFEVYVTPTFDTASEPGAAPLAVALEAPYPNPFRTEATVAFVLDRDARVAVEVFDALGRRVALLHDGTLGGSRRHAFAFRPGDLPAGVYYARVHGDGFSETRPLVRVR